MQAELIIDRMKISQFCNDIQAVIRDAKCIDEDQIPEDIKELIPIDQNDEEDQRVPCLSDKVEIQSEPGRGRFMVAKSNIEPGKWFLNLEYNF